MSKLKLSEFDRYGTFRLTKNETAGLEDLVQKLGDNEYLSRNANYYRLVGDSFDEICTKYECLNKMLPMEGKPAFVVCEKMYDLAVRAVNTIQQMEHNTHLYQDGQHFDTASQKCAQECADNLVRLIHAQTAVPTATNLRAETRLRPDKFIDYGEIEADNIKQLFMCANALPDDTEHLITPGRGSSKLGALVQSVRQHKGLKPLGFTQVAFSLYDDDSLNNGKPFKTPEHLPEKVLVMDDIIYRGVTLTRIKKELTKQGHQVTNGAITTAFYNCALESIFARSNWANYIDIIPNQYAKILEQTELGVYLKYKEDDLNDFLTRPNNYNGHDTGDFIAMREAENRVGKLGADLYQVSEKISPAAVAYNQKFRAQVEKYNAEFQNSLNI